MQLSLTEDQTMIARTANAFTEEHCKVTRLRALRDGYDELGYSRDVYVRMAELGWTALPFSEDDGGAGLGLAGTILVTESLGRSLAPEPFLALILSGSALAASANTAQRDQWLAPLIAGEKVIALAYQEPESRYDLWRIKTRAERTPRGFRLTGSKMQVLAGASADAYIVTALTSGRSTEGVAMFLVPAGARGLTVTRQQRIDSRNVALVELDGAEIDESAILGEAGDAGGVLESVFDRGAVALCGEMLGGMSAALEKTLEYLKQRQQFGVAIGTFQALKHRAARLFIEVELSRSATMAAARAVDAGLPDAARLVSVAKARCSDAYTLIANEAVQMHGGIGMTDEHDIGLYMKHARVCELTFGDAAFHRARFARLSGY